MNHPNLSDEINARLNDPQRNEDLDLSKIMPGVTLRFQTHNTRYVITRRTDGLWDVSGNHRYFPTPTVCRIHGSTWGGSMLKLNYIGLGMHVEIIPNEGEHRGKIIITSEVTRIGDVDEVKGVH